MEFPVQIYLDRLAREMREVEGGTPYQGIPATAEMDPALYGVSLTTVDGHSYSAGDSDHLFSLQSISKALTYGMALDDLGTEDVLAKIDVEPSGDPFNEISLQSGTGRPDNPMINAGAIATTSLIKGRGGRDRMGRILMTFSAAAGRELKVSEQVFRSEDRTGHRNRAMAWLLRSFDIIESDPEPIVQDYFRQCSVMVTAEDLSMMAATLANQGVNPASGERVFTPHTVRWMLSVMSTCGMYDDAGTWAIEVGLPAKSGVGGGVLVVVPGQLGIGVFSPPLDEHGTSVRGAQTVRQLADDLGLHYSDAPPVGRSTIRSDYRLADTPSGVPRTPEATQALETHGQRCRILELGGDLGFAETETLARVVVEADEADPSTEIVMLDLRKVDDFGRAAVAIFARLIRELLSSGTDVVLVDEDDSLTQRVLEQAQGSGEGSLPDPLTSEEDRRAALRDAESTTAEFQLFLTRAQAVEWAEHRILARHAPDLLPANAQQPLTSSVMQMMSPADAEQLSVFLEPRTYKPGQVIRRAGQPFGGIYFITSGQVELTGQGSGKRRYRQIFLSPGMTFGEIALGQAGRQLSTVRAVGEVTTQVLTAQLISALEETDPQLAIKLWSALARDAYTMVEQAFRETGARDS